jgi:tetratricopeptide (TPR) repeat protein
MPENANAWVNLGVVRSALGRRSEAIEAYRRALSHDPRHATAALNLAVIHEDGGETHKAAVLFARAVECGLESVEEVSAVHDFYVAKDMAKQAVDLWSEFLARYPDSVGARAFRAWSRALAGDVERARLEATWLCSTEPVPSLARATLAFAALVEEQYPIAVEQTDALCATGGQGADARQRFLRRLEMFGHRKPGMAWTYCLAAELLIADGQLDGARIGVDLCAQRCAELDCRDRVKSLRARLAGAPTTTAPLPDTP